MSKQLMLRDAVVFLALLIVVLVLADHLSARGAGYLVLVAIGVKKAVDVGKRFRPQEGDP